MRIKSALLMLSIVNLMACSKSHHSNNGPQVIPPSGKNTEVSVEKEDSNLTGIPAADFLKSKYKNIKLICYASVVTEKDVLEDKPQYEPGVTSKESYAIKYNVSFMFPSRDQFNVAKASKSNAFAIVDGLDLS